MSAEATSGDTMEALLEAPPQVPDQFALFCKWLPGARLQLGQLDSNESYRSWMEQQTASIQQQPNLMPLWAATSALDASAGYRDVSLSALQERARTLLLDGAWSTKEEDKLVLCPRTNCVANPTGTHL